MEAVAVGQEEEPLSAVWSAGMGVCSEQTPLRIEPHFGKVPENIGESVSDDPWDVLEEDPSRSDLLDGVGNEWPEPPVIGLTSSLACCAERLARETGRDEIHSSAVEVAWEGCEIVPYRSLIQGLFLHPRHEDGRREGFPLDVTHSS